RIELIGAEARDTMVLIARGITPQVAAGHGVQIDVVNDRRIVERTVGGRPDVAAEGSARELVLRPVVVAAIAAEQLRAAVAKHVVRRADPGRNLLAPSEMDRNIPISERGDLLVFKARTEIQREPADAPLVLRVEIGDIGSCLAKGPEIVHRIVTVRASVRSDAGHRAGNSRIPPDLDAATGIPRIYLVLVVADPASHLEGMVSGSRERGVVVGLEVGLLRRVIFGEL